MKTILNIFLALILTATSSYAWDSFGHMTVAFVAYQKLTPEIKQRANQLIKLNPQYSTWSSWIPGGTSAADQDMMIFMIAATWPDEIKGIPHHLPPTNPVTGQSYVADGTQNGDRAEGSPNPTANEGYTDNSMHKYWHFVDMPFSTDGSSLPPVPTPNAQERIALFRSALASSSSDDLKSYDLVWILHLVGDVHQPLHCATRVSTDDTDGDAGGNKVTLSNKSELHEVWDNLLGTGSDQKIIKAVIKAGKHLPPADLSPAGDADEKDWVKESFDIARTNVYVPPIGAGDGPFTLTSDYTTNARQIAQKRVALAGARLANLLNDNLK